MCVVLSWQEEAELSGAVSAHTAAGGAGDPPGDGDVCA